ncbi:MAG TPA: class I SAM-dependent methyltransferase [bacterium]|jgi:ubiquinone/menaquinone biosynthesis C-methylase UbiE|nr:class I SAM-dependent methyltransferase [bacterium]HOG38490.1 class I SAM-dependent methyltransferase [bacterium]
MELSSTKHYYGPRGEYLKEHENYFSDKQLKKDLSFLKNALKLKKTDKILDIGCGHARHTIELKKQGFDIHGLDASEYLIKLAKKQSKKEKLSIKFYNQNIHSLNIKQKYDKAFIFFSDLASINLDKAIKNIKKILQPNGLFLLDSDNFQRLIRYQKQHPESPYIFDKNTMILKDKATGKLIVKYYKVPELKKLFTKNKFKVISIYGNYKKDPIDNKSDRIIIIAQNLIK